MTTTPSSISSTARLARVLEVRLVDDERPGRRQLAERAARVVRPAGERDRRRSRRRPRPRRGSARDPVERVGRLVRDRDRVARPDERAGAEEDQVVAARAEHDVLRLDARVVARSRARAARVAAVRVRVDLGERTGDRARAAPTGAGRPATLPSKRRTSTGSSPARRAISSVDGAQPYGWNPAGSGRSAGARAAAHPSIRSTGTSRIDDAPAASSAGRRRPDVGSPARARAPRPCPARPAGARSARARPGRAAQSAASALSGAFIIR